MTGDEIKRKLAELNLLEDLPLPFLYLRFLHPNSNEHDHAEWVARYKCFAVGVANSPEFIRDLLRDNNWRPTLIGSVIVNLLRADEYQEDMVRTLKNGNWVAPQLAVSIALVDRGKGENMLSEIIAGANADSNPKTIISAYCGLVFLNSPVAQAFSSTPLFETLRHSRYEDGSMMIARRNWEYWSGIEPAKPKG